MALRIGQFVAAFLILPMLAGCFATTAKFEKNLESWRGKYIDRLVAKWGTPDRRWDHEDGRMTVSWYRAQQKTVGGYTTTTPVETYHSGTITDSYGTGYYSGSSVGYVEQTVPGRLKTFSCEVTMQVDKYGFIDGWSYRGNACKARTAVGD